MKKSEVEKVFPGHAEAVFDLIKGSKHPESYRSVETWVRQCYNQPRYVDKLLLAINEEIEGCGVEAVFDNDFQEGQWPIMEYINHGDAYTPTILYDHVDKEFIVASWADWYETYEVQKQDDEE